MVEKGFHPRGRPTSRTCLFIDNDKRNTESWEFFAGIKKIEIATYNDVDDFLREATLFDKKTKIYIDLNLERDKNGIEYAKDIADVGFSEIYIATGIVDVELNVKDYPWLSGILEKKFPL